ncbi:MAG: lipid-A-disaccharide synthase [Saprospiraceae bacterium]|nr:lipid-A-disaccharide synthase [Saprospiraceae bacterium]
MRYFIIAGEASGDLHGAGLVKALRQIDPEADIRAWGGERMEGAGAKILKHYRALAFMGFIEVVRNLPAILRNFRQVKREITAFKPHTLILIDYPGFNLRMARWAATQGLRVDYYISPQLWAWKESRVEIVRKYVDAMYVILPFERPFYQRHGIEVTYVGHPLLEAIDAFQAKAGPARRNDSIALLPGSRKQEIRHALPVMLDTAERFPRYHFVIAGAPHVNPDIYGKLLASRQLPNTELRIGDTYAILHAAHAAVTTSGTATLETALFGVPQVVCYKGNALSFQIARRLVKVPFISLVNLVAGVPVVDELIQEHFTAERVTQSLDRILDGPVREEVLRQYATLRGRLDEGGASQRVAGAIVKALTSNDGAV